MLHGLILYPRATCSTDRPWRPVYPSEATSGYDIWPCRGQPPSWGKHVRVRSIPMVYGQKTNHRRFPVDPTIPHAPTRESVPSDHRTKRCRRGSEPIVYGSRPCNFAAEGKVAESEGYRFLGLKTRVRFSSKSFGIFFLSTLTPRKFHNQNVTPRRIKIISEMD